MYEVVPTDGAKAVKEEAARQLVSFRRLVGRDPTHLDSHQHVHRREPAGSVLDEIARELAIPLRHHAPKIRYYGDFYGQTGEGLPLTEAIGVDKLIGILTALPPGVTELACHPGLDDKLRSAYRSERAEEVTVLCDPRVRATIIAGGIELRSFGDLALRARLR